MVRAVLHEFFTACVCVLANSHANVVNRIAKKTALISVCRTLAVRSFARLRLPSYSASSLSVVVDSFSPYTSIFVVVVVEYYSIYSRNECGAVHS